MTDDRDGGPAFPRPAGESGNYENPAQDGMTLRDWFAGQALVMAGTYSQSLDATEVELAEGIARKAYQLADAMIKAREKS